MCNQYIFTVMIKSPDTLTIKAVKRLIAFNTEQNMRSAVDKHKPIEINGLKFFIKCIVNFFKVWYNNVAKQILNKTTWSKCVFL